MSYGQIYSVLILSISVRINELWTNLFSISFVHKYQNISVMDKTFE
jgi:hypothetical protein